MIFALKVNGLDIDLASRVGKTLCDEDRCEFDLAALLNQAVVELPSPRIFMDKETFVMFRRQAKGGPYPPDAADKLRKSLLEIKPNVAPEEIEKEISEYIASGIKPNTSFVDGDLPTYRVGL